MQGAQLSRIPAVEVVVVLAADREQRTVPLPDAGPAVEPGQGELATERQHTGQRRPYAVRLRHRERAAVRGPTENHLLTPASRSAATASTGTSARGSFQSNSATRYVVASSSAYGSHWQRSPPFSGPSTTPDVPVPISRTPTPLPSLVVARTKSPPASAAQSGRSGSGKPFGSSWRADSLVLGVDDDRGEELPDPAAPSSALLPAHPVSSATTTNGPRILLITRAL